MMRILIMSIFLAVASVASTYADDKTEDNSALTKILVTFADPGMTNATRAGPAYDSAGSATRPGG